MSKGVWDSLIDAAKEERVVQVTLSPGTKINKPKRTTGRPKGPTVRFGPTEYAHYAGFDPATGSRPHCAFRGCSKRLTRKQRVGCCEAHEKLAIEAAQSLLVRAGMPIEDEPEDRKTWVGL